MGLLDRLFGEKVKKEDTPAATIPVQRKQEKSMPSSLLEYLDESEGTDELYEMLRNRSASEIESACSTFPIEALRLDWESIERDLRNSKRFELITILAQIFVQYDEILDKNPELGLPATLPSKKFADILMSRLIPFISNQQNIELAHTIRIRLYDFAVALMQAGRDHDALTCFLVSLPSIKEDHFFWICACRFNIAQVSNNSDDISAAINDIEQIVNGKVSVPQQYISGAEQMFGKLKEIDSKVSEEPNSIEPQAGDCCELCKKNYKDQHRWGLECSNCTSKLPNDKDYDIGARFCHSCLSKNNIGGNCPQCGERLRDSIL